MCPFHSFCILRYREQKAYFFSAFLKLSSLEVENQVSPKFAFVALLAGRGTCSECQVLNSPESMGGERADKDYCSMGERGELIRKSESPRQSYIFHYLII